MLLFLYPDSKHPHPEDINKYVCAEIPDPISSPQLYEVVQEFMLHGPCGAANPRSPCMIDGLCSKFYPKEFVAYTRLNEDGYPMYRRRDNGRFIEKAKIDLIIDTLCPTIPSYFLNISLISMLNGATNVDLSSTYLSTLARAMIE